MQSFLVGSRSARRRAAEQEEMYHAWEIRIWSRVLLVAATIGTTLLLLNVFLGFLSGEAFAFLAFLVVLLYIATMFNHTWARQERLAREQDRLQTMFMAFLQRGQDTETL